MPMPTLRQTLAALALLVAPAATLAQPAPAEPAPAPIALTDQPFEIKSLGLTIRLPVGARLDTSSVGGSNASFTLFAENNTWIIRMHSPASRDKELTAPEIAEGLLEELRKTVTGVDPRTKRPVQGGVTILDRNDALIINGSPAARFYARVPRIDGAVLVSGYTVFHHSPGQFVIFQLDCIDAEYPRARVAYETILATVRLRGAAELNADRAAGLLAGDRLLAQFNSDDLVNMLPAGPRFYRLYRPGKTGLEGDDTEVAYQVVTMRRGQRGELDPGKPKSRWLQADRDWGIVVNVKSRFLDGNRLVDSEAISFLSNDRESESWSIRMAVKKGRDAASFTETGARTSDAIEVNIIQPAQPQTTKRWRKPPEGYLSQVETMLLPMMLARARAETEFAFYTYQPQHNDIILRRDALRQSETPGQWLMITRPNEDAAADQTILDADGMIVRKNLASGVVMEAIKVERLMKLWRAKGLPTE